MLPGRFVAFALFVIMQLFVLTSFGCSSFGCGNMGAFLANFLFVLMFALAIIICHYWSTRTNAGVPILWYFNTAGWVVLMILIIMFGHDEVATDGRRTAPGVPHPVVYRMWRNLSTFPAPAAMWEGLGFRVVDFDHDTALEVVAGAGYRDVWEQLPNYAARADLFRYIIINAHGGWWADADVLPLPGLAVVANNFDTVLFHEACGFSLINRLKFKLGMSTVTHAPQWRCSMFAAPKGWAPLGSALEMLRHRLQRHSSGGWTKSAQIDITGPGLLTDAINAYKPASDAKRIPCNMQQSLFNHIGLGTWLVPGNINTVKSV